MAHPPDRQPPPGRRRSLWQSYKRLSLAFRLALSFWLVLLLGMGSLILLVSNYQRILLELQAQSLGHIVASQFATSVTEPLFTEDLLSMEVLVYNLVKDPRVSMVMIMDETGTVLAQARTPRKKRRTLPKADRAIPTEFVLMSVKVITVTEPVIFKDITAGSVVVDFIPVELNQGFNWILKTLIWVTLLTTMLMMLTTFILSRRISHPINALVAATRQIGRGDFDVRLQENELDEFGHLASALNQMAIDLEHKQRVESLLNKVVAADVASALLTRGDAPQMHGELVDTTVLFVDIVSFTSLAERLPPDEVVQLLNRNFSYFNVCSELFFGCVDKFIGDCAMIVFGTPKHSPDHRIQAIACAVAIQRLLRELRFQDPVHNNIHVRIGISSGEVMAGTVGAQQRMEYTVIGDTVNLASRLTALAKPDQILADEATVDHGSVQNKVVVNRLGEFAVKGKLRATHAVEIASVAPEYAKLIENLIDDILS